MPFSTNCSGIRIHISQRWSQSPLQSGAATAIIALRLGRVLLLWQDDPAFVVGESKNHPRGGREEVFVQLNPSIPWQHSPGWRHGFDARGGAGWLDRDVRSVACADFLHGPCCFVENPPGNRYLKERWLPARQRLPPRNSSPPGSDESCRLGRFPWFEGQLAVSIQVDRQKYGDLGCSQALERVQGLCLVKRQAL